MTKPRKRRGASIMVLGYPPDANGVDNIECCYMSKPASPPPSLPIPAPSSNSQVRRGLRHSIQVAASNDVNQLYRKWRQFRLRQREERKIAVQEMEEDIKTVEDVKRLEQEQQREEDACTALEPMLLFDCGMKPSYEMILPNILHQQYNSCHQTVLWDVFSPFGQYPFTLDKRCLDNGDKKSGINDDDTASTAACSSVDDDCSVYSRYSWQSAVTVKADNRDECDPCDDMFDDPWSAAERGDLAALEKRWKGRHDWTEEDVFGHTPLYYACQSGAAKNLRVVLFLLQQWPSMQHIPPTLLKECKKDAINRDVVNMLEHPHCAENIILASEAGWFDDAEPTTSDPEVDQPKDTWSWVQRQVPFLQSY